MILKTIFTTFFFVISFNNTYADNIDNSNSCNKYIAIIDTRNIIEKSHIGRKIQKLIDNYQEEIIKKVDKYQMNLETKKNDLQNDLPIMTDIKIKEEQNKIQKLYESYLREIDELKNKNVIYQQKLISKVLEKINFITEKVAVDKCFYIVLDKITVIYLDKSKDITNDVIQKLDNQYKNIITD